MPRFYLPTEEAIMLQIGRKCPVCGSKLRTIKSEFETHKGHKTGYKLKNCKRGHRMYEHYDNGKLTSTSLSFSLSPNPELHAALMEVKQ